MIVLRHLQLALGGRFIGKFIEAAGTWQAAQAVYPQKRCEVTAFINRMMLDVVSAFGEQTAREDIGMGIMRDGFAELLFPGTRTILTRSLIPLRPIDIQPG